MYVLVYYIFSILYVGNNIFNNNNNFQLNNYISLSLSGPFYVTNLLDKYRLNVLFIS